MPSSAQKPSDKKQHQLSATVGDYDYAKIKKINIEEDLRETVLIRRLILYGMKYYDLKNSPATRDELFELQKKYDDREKVR